MALTIEEAFLPAVLTAEPMSDAEFDEFCAEHPGYFIEMTAEGDIVIMPPNYSLTAARNQEVGGQLREWAMRDGRGFTTDSSGGFVLPNGARRSPDAAWTLKRRVRELERESLMRYWRLCPDFVVELRSQTDRLKALRAKMQEWTDNGAQLAWLVDPERRTVEIYRPGQQSEISQDATTVAGEGLLAGFVLDLVPIWDLLGC